MSHTQSESSQEMKSETRQNADVHTHTHNTHTDVLISNNFLLHLFWIWGTLGEDQILLVNTVIQEGQRWGK